MAGPVIARYGIFTETEYEIYPADCTYKAVRYSMPEKAVKESLGGSLEQFHLALAALFYGVAYNLGVYRLLDSLSKGSRKCK